MSLTPIDISRFFMAKRKRDEASASSEEDQDDRTRRKLGKVIATGTTRIATALSTARRFERQKLGKRQQQFQQSKNDVDGRRVNVEIAVLKSMDMDALAKHRLHKDLVKTKSIQKTGLLPEEVVLPKIGNLDKTTSDLMARLFKQKAVGEAVDQSMTAVREVLGLNANAGSKQQKVHLLVSNGVNGSKHKALVSEVSQAAAKTRDSPIKQQMEDTMSVSDSEDEFMGFSSRVASASDSESDDESGAEDNDETPTTGIPRRQLSVSLSPSPPDEEPKVKPKRLKVAAPPPTRSAFLPSLSMGGYMSASEGDSDATDVEEHIAPRKNRRGQRARQAIWEKKFKEKAKHLKDPPKPKKGKDKRDDGWDAQRGAVGRDDRRSGRGMKGGRTKGPSGGNAAPLGKNTRSNGVEKPKEKHRDDAGSLHPSWEAKKHAKQQSAGIGAFKGKKMTFD